MNPVTDVFRAVVYPFKAVFVVGLCWFINATTSPHDPWWHWVAFGMAIGLVATWARALRSVAATAGVAGAGYLAWRWWDRRAASRTGRVVDA